MAKINFNSSIKKLVLPAFEQHGYHCVALGGGAAQFRNAEDTVIVEYDVPPMLTRFMSGGVPGQKVLRVNLYVNADGWSPVRLQDLKCCPDIPPEKLYRDKEEFEAGILHTNEEMFSKVLPVLESITAHPTPLREEYYAMLAQQPDARAKAFAEAHGQKLEDSPETRAWCEAWLSSRIPAEPEDRPAAFERDLEEYLGFAAFCGELRNQELGTAWTWKSVPALDGTEERTYVVRRETGGFSQSLSPLLDVMEFWNLSSDVNRPLFPRWF